MTGFGQPHSAPSTPGTGKGIINVSNGQVMVNISSEELKLYNIINDYRKSKNLPAIPLSYSLTYVAQQHCIDLATYRPNLPDTCNLHSWSDKGNWAGVCYTSNHKNVDKVYIKPKELTGYDGYGYEIAYYHSASANAENAVEGWKNSSGHNKMMLNAGVWGTNWKAMGIGIFKNYATVWFGHEADTQTGK